MLQALIIIVLSLSTLSGCVSMSGKREPFQIYEGKRDCVRCKPQEYWGFIPRTVTRKGEQIYIGDFRSTQINNLSREWAAACYGVAKDTLRTGYTHFQILDRNKWRENEYVESNPQVTINLTETSPGTFSGSGNISGGGMLSSDKDGNWHHRYYYRKGKPDCSTNNYICSTRNQFNIEECPYEGEELRRFTEGKVSAFDQANDEKNRLLTSCVMKQDPFLMLEDAYFVMRVCGFEDDGWHSAKDTLKKYAPFVDDKE